MEDDDDDDDDATPAGLNGRRADDSIKEAGDRTAPPRTVIN